MFHGVNKDYITKFLAARGFGHASLADPWEPCQEEILHIIDEEGEYDASKEEATHED